MEEVKGKENQKLKTFKVEVTETTSRVMDVEAETPEDAWQKVCDMYLNGEIILDIWIDFFDYKIRLI